MQRSQGRDGKRQAADDAKGPAGLEHGAALVSVEAEFGAGHGDAGKIAAKATGARQGDAVGMADVAEVVDASDEGADQERVDVADEAGRDRAVVVEEQREQAPGQGDDDDDEEDEDGGGRHYIGVVEDFDEPGEHADGGDLGCVRMDGWMDGWMEGWRDGEDSREGRARIVESRRK